MVVGILVLIAKYRQVRTPRSDIAYCINRVQIWPTHPQTVNSTVNYFPLFCSINAIHYGKDSILRQPLCVIVQYIVVPSALTHYSIPGKILLLVNILTINARPFLGCGNKCRFVKSRFDHVWLTVSCRSRVSDASPPAPTNVFLQYFRFTTVKFRLKLAERPTH